MQFCGEWRANARRWPPYRSYDVIIYDVFAGHENIYANNSWQNRARAVCVASLRLSCHVARVDMLHDPGHSSAQVIWPHLTSIFKNSLSLTKCMCFDASRREKHDGVKQFPLSFLFQKLFLSNFCLPCPGKVKVWPKVVESGMFWFRTSQTSHWSLLRNCLAITGQTSSGYPRRGFLGWRKKQLRARVTGPFTWKCLTRKK